MITVVTGPPCAGKTTHVQQHKRPGDIVVDFDLIAVALGSPVGHGHSPAHLRATLAALHGAISATLSARPAGAWIIHPHPSNADLQRYKKARAVILTIDPGEKIVRQRAAAAGRTAETDMYIDQWYRTRREPA